MKNFDDFLASISEEQMSVVMHRMNEAVEKSIKINGGLPEADQIGLFSIQGSVELLRLYHEWIMGE